MNNVQVTNLIYISSDFFCKHSKGNKPVSLGKGRLESQLIERLANFWTHSIMSEAHYYYASVLCATTLILELTRHQQQTDFNLLQIYRQTLILNSDSINT